MEKNLANYRRSYEKGELRSTQIKENPIAQFQHWFDEVDAQSAPMETNAMTVSTIGSDGFPKNRVVLLKSFSDEGFVFYTNYESEKGKAISENPQLCLSFFWPNFERQVIIKGTAEKVPAAVSDAYFSSRPLESQLSAVVSTQSEKIANRAFLEEKLAVLKVENKEKIQRPENWGGFLVRPVSIEFWQGRKNRLHDRFLYAKNENQQWEINRLAP